MTTLTYRRGCEDNLVDDALLIALTLSASYDDTAHGCTFAVPSLITTHPTGDDNYYGDRHRDINHVIQPS